MSQNLYEAQAAHATASDIQRSTFIFSEAKITDNPNEFSAAPATPNVAPTAGTMLLIRMPASNTGASSIAFCGLAPVPIVHDDGSDVSAGELLEGGIYLLVYTGAAWQVVGLPVPSV